MTLVNADLGSEPDLRLRLPTASAPAAAAVGRAEFHALLLAVLPALRSRAGLLERNDAAAEDLVHDTIERALVNARRFAPGTSMKSWTFRIMYNLFVDRLREARREEPLDEERLAALPAPEGEPVPRWDALSLGDVVELLPRVGASLRRTFTLAYVEQRPNHAIAAELGMPVATVATQLFRGRAQMRELLLERLAARRAPAAG